MDNDSTPGIWQDGNSLFVLAHIAYCLWIDDKGGNVFREEATKLKVFFVGGSPAITFIARQGDSIIRALNLYWETRTLSPGQPSETR